MKDLKTSYGDWALVTGASSGIGEIFATKLAAAGMNIVLVARRKDRLDQLSTKLKESSMVDTRVITADLSDENETKNIISQVDDLEIGVLVNNAGFANTGNFLDNNLDDEIRLLNTNCKSFLILAHGLGNKMKARNKGAIIFLASIVAFASTSRWATYAASKGFDLQIAEALSLELREHNIDVLALCPGFTRTEFATMAKLNDMMAMDADKVVDIALDKLGKNSLVIPGFMNKLNALSLRLAPRFMNTRIFSMVVSPTQNLELKNKSV